MSESETLNTEMFAPTEGPTTPDEDDAFGPESDDPRAAGTFEEPYEVPDFDPAYELRDMCGEEVGC
jgi:hypothetical protein